MPHVDAVTAVLVFVATGVTDAVYVRFAAAIAGRRRLAAANWSAAWYLLSSYAVISYTQSWVYVVFAAAGSWVGAFVSLSAGRGRRARAGDPL